MTAREFRIVLWLYFQHSFYDSCLELGFGGLIYFECFWEKAFRSGGVYERGLMKLSETCLIKNLL